MTLRDDSGEIRNDWIRVDDDAYPPMGAQIIVSFDRFEKEGAALLGAAPAVGVHIANSTPPEALIPYFAMLGLIAVDFPSFADGRGFSVARRLRDIGFGGELRASGPVIADQYAYLRACGFSTVETPEKIDIRQPQGQWDAAATAMSLGYQRGYGGVRNVFEARRLARSA